MICKKFHIFAPCLSWYFMNMKQGLSKAVWLTWSWIKLYLTVGWRHSEILKLLSTVSDISTDSDEPAF